MKERRIRATQRKIAILGGAGLLLFLMALVWAAWRMARRPSLSAFLFLGLCVGALGIAAALSFQVVRLSGQLAIHRDQDAPTGLYNKRFLLATINEWMANQISFGLLMIDMDHFKEVNDTHGHLAGDAVLRHLAAVLQMAIRRNDLLCRYGGEEFVLLVRGVDSLTVVEQVAERIRKAVERTAFPYVLHKTCSTGYGLWDQEESGEELIARIDAALYAAKTGGRNQSVASKTKGDSP